MSALPLESARAADLEQLASLLRSAELPLAGLTDHFPAGYVLARRAGAVVGAAGLEVYSTAGLLRSLVTAPAVRGEGIGKALVENRLARAGELGLDAVYVLTTTAAGLFRRLGFTDTARDEAPAALRRAPEFAFACPSSAACLSYRLERP